MKQNRGKLEIVCEILNLCRTPQRRTRIMYGANLSYAQTVSYLRDISRRHLVERQKNLYVLTPYGQEFLEGLQLVLDLWFEREIPEIIEGRF